MQQFLESELVKEWHLLGFGPERMAEMRCIDMTPGAPKEKKCLSRVTTTGITPFVQWCREWNGRGNCFVGRNARKLDHTSQVKDITCISLDIDPIREKDTAATEEQVEEAINAGRKLLEAIGKRFNCNGSLALSGNGALVLFANKNPTAATVEFQSGLGEFQHECAGLISEFKGVKIDATQDNARLVKCVGTVSVKGGIRITRFLNVASDAGNGDGLFAYVGGLGTPKPVDQKTLLVKSGYASRSEADYALALFLAKRGASKADILAALARNPIGRNERTDDHERIADKVLAEVASKGVAATPMSVELVDDVVLHSPESSLANYKKIVAERKKHVKPELPTGFPKLDRATHGFRRGEIYTVAAWPGVGKSTFILNAVNLILSTTDYRVLMFTTEMTYDQVWDRFYALNTRIPSEDINFDRLDDVQRATVAAFEERFKKFRLQVYDRFQPVFAKVAAIARDVKPDVLVFDHIQHIGDEVKMLSEFTRGLKRLAMELNCAVVLASQLTRPLKAFDYKTKEVHEAPPRLSSLKGCSTLEEESAFVLLMNKSKFSVDEETPVVETNLAKNRFGPQPGEEFALHGKIHLLEPLVGEKKP